MRELREKLRKEILAWEGGSVVHNSTVDELNRLMADYPMRTRLKTKGSGTELWFEPGQPEDLFVRLRTAPRHCSPTWIAVVSASVLIVYSIFGHYKGTRRWCSRQLCGNRLKVAAYAARQRAQSHKR